MSDLTPSHFRAMADALDRDGQPNAAHYLQDAARQIEELTPKADIAAAIDRQRRQAWAAHVDDFFTTPSRPLRERF